MIKKIALTMIIALVCLPCFADVIHLKSGGEIKGNVSHYEDGKFTIELPAGGKTTISMGQVQAITFKKEEKKAQRVEAGPGEQDVQQSTVSAEKPKTSPFLSASETSDKLDKLISTTITNAKGRTFRGDFGIYLKPSNVKDSSTYMKLCEKLAGLKKLKTNGHSRYRETINLYIGAAKKLKKIKKTEAYLYKGKSYRSRRKEPKRTLKNPRTAERRAVERYNKETKEYNSKIKKANALYKDFYRILENAHEARAKTV